MSARIVCVMTLVCGWFASRAAEPSPAMTLTGIICDGTNKAVLVEPSRWFPTILKEGERVTWDTPGFEVLRIMPESASVEVRIGKLLTNTLTLDLSSEQLAKKPALMLKSADLNATLQLYQSLAGRTVLRVPSLPQPGQKFDLVVAGGVARAEIVKALRDALLDQKVLLQNFGDKFTVAAFSRQTNLLASLPRPPLPALNNAPIQAGNEEIIPAGVIRFQVADMSAVLEVYAELAQRTILRPCQLPDSKLTIQTQTACSRDEAVWMFETALRLADLTVATHGNKFVYVGLLHQAALVPRFDPDAAKGEAKFTARIVPANVFAPPPPRPLGEPPVKNAPPVSHHLQLLKLYCEVTGREPLLGVQELAWIKVNLKTQTPLTAGEMTCALEAVAALNGFKFELVGEKGVRIVAPNQKGGGQPLVF